MKVKATLEFIHPFEGGLFLKDRIYEVADNDGNLTLLKIGYFKPFNGEIEITEVNKAVPEMRFRKTERSFSTDKAQKTEEKVEEKESKEEVKTKEYKGKKKTK